MLKHVLSCFQNGHKKQVPAQHDGTDGIGLCLSVQIEVARRALTHAGGRTFTASEGDRLLSHALVVTQRVQIRSCAAVFPLDQASPLRLGRNQRIAQFSGNFVAI